MLYEFCKYNSYKRVIIEYEKVFFWISLDFYRETVENLRELVEKLMLGEAGS